MKALRGSKLSTLGIGMAGLLAIAACDTTNDADATTGGGGQQDNRAVVAPALQLADDLQQSDLANCDSSKTPEGEFAPGADVAGVGLVKPDDSIVYAGAQVWDDGKVCQNDFANPAAVLGAPGAAADFLSLNGGILNVTFESTTPARVGDQVVIYTSTKTTGSKLDSVRAGDTINGMWDNDTLAVDIEAKAGGEITLTLSEADAAKQDSATTF